MTKEIRFGLVGAGAIGKAYIQAFEKCPGAILAAVADPVVPTGLPCRVFKTVKEMLAGEKLDAAIICTPPRSHPEITIELLGNGLHVICEKPLSIDSESAQRMALAAERSGRLLTMASKFRYVEDIQKAKTMVTEGAVGDLVLVENAFTGYVDMRNRWNSNPILSGGGVLIDNGTHSLDIMRYFLGPLEFVRVMEGLRTQGLSVEETVHIFVRSEQGVNGNIDLSWSINKELPYFLSLYGSQGTIQVGWKESRYRKAGAPDWTKIGNGYNKNQAFQNQIKNFAAAIRGDEPLRITVADGIASVQAVEAAYRSVTHSPWVSVR